MQDGSTIQLGIGGIPNAAATALVDKDLGVHSEWPVYYAVGAGSDNQPEKDLNANRSIFTFAMGSQVATGLTMGIEFRG